MKLPFKAYWDLLSQHIRPQKGRFILLSVLLLASIGLRIYAPQIMRVFIDSALAGEALRTLTTTALDRKSTRLNSSHSQISYAVFCLKKKTQNRQTNNWICIRCC